MDLSFLRKNMVDCQLKPNKIINLNLIDAFLKVPREIFVNKKNINQCYLDVNIDLTKNRFLLNPMVSARLIQSLNISKDDTVLTIGSGVGYNSVILSYLCNTVIGIENIKSFYDFSVDVLIKLEVNNVVFIKSKIENGYSDQQPYDCIIIEGGVNHVPNEILNQLSENGRLVAVEIKEGNVGKATIYQRYGKEFIKKYLFDAYVPFFEGFKKNKTLIFNLYAKKYNIFIFIFFYYR